MSEGIIKQGDFKCITLTLKKIVDLSKKHPKQLFAVVPNEHKSVRYRLKNGKFAFFDSYNANYDFSHRATTLRQKKGVVYIFWAEDENGKLIPMDLL